MRLAWIGTLALILTMLILPASAEESNASVNITGGSEAGQSCVSAKSCYYPDTITVSPNTVIAWTNIDNTAHTVTSGSPSENSTGTVFDSDMIGPGGTYSFIFISSGTYDYFCSIHPWMTGEVIVTSPLATNSSSNSATTPEFGPLVILVFVISVFVTIFLTKNRLIFRF
jgi:plastocyanin